MDVTFRVLSPGDVTNPPWGTIYITIYVNSGGSLGRLREGVISRIYLGSEGAVDLPCNGANRSNCSSQHVCRCARGHRPLPLVAAIG